MVKLHAVLYLKSISVWSQNGNNLGVGKSQREALWSDDRTQ